MILVEINSINFSKCAKFTADELSSLYSIKIQMFLIVSEVHPKGAKKTSVYGFRLLTAASH